MTTFLKFPDEDTAKEVLADYVTEDGWITAGIGWALDPLGTIYRDEVELEGWHVNFVGQLEQDNNVYTPDGVAAPDIIHPELGTLSLEAQLYIVTPNNPARVFA